MTRTRLIFLTLILGGIGPLGALGVDTTLPALGIMGIAFNAEETISLSISAFFLGAAFSQLLIGPLADRFGRRPVLLLGLTLYALAAIASAFAPSLAVLVGIRFIHGLTSSTGQIIARAVARDLFDRDAVARLLSFTMVVSGSVPVLMPVIGGQLTQLIGWEAVFIFIAAYTIMMTLVCGIALPETLAEKDQNALRFMELLRAFLVIIRHRESRGYIICLVCSSAGFFAWIAGSSRVLIDIYGESITAYSLEFALVSAGGFMTALFVGFVVVRFGIDHLVGAGTVIASLAGVTMLTLLLTGLDNAVFLVASMATFRIGLGLLNPTATAGALSPFPHMAGRASSVLGFLQQGTGAIVVPAIGFYSAAGALPMIGTITVAGVAGLLSYMFLIRRGAAPAPPPF
ncbi:MAG: multidrug effflux MFS transporter [Proteobacteria bacterium]|nr:multidrug effflux MFS transporter [Pseudomonadota bacterium]